MEFSHIPVLLNPVLELLNIRPDGIYVDGTAGGAGHSSEIAKRLQDGRLIALDKDPDAVAVATERLSPYPCAQVVQSDYSEMRAVLDRLEIPFVDGVLMDLGVSSFQLDTPERGFSYQTDSPLDMRMSRSGVSAADLVNTLDEQALARILYDYGEEKCAGRIANRIVREREKAPILTTLQLVDIIRAAMPAKMKRDGHPAKRTFQALRIAVNDELTHLQDGLQAAFHSLKPGGRLAIITFQSLEDRIVKQAFRQYTQGCVCPPDFPVCVCGHKPEGELVNRKPIEADEQELEMNPRSHSARLRVIERLPS